MDGAEPCFKVIDDGVVFLGNPVGTEEYRRGKLSTLVSEMAKPLPTLTRVDPQSAYAMLQLCYNARPCYLTRVSEPDLYWEAMGEFDAAIDAGVGGIARITGPSMLPVLRSLPQRHGGMGLPRHQGPQSEKACLASREHTLEFVNRYRPELLTGTDKWRPVVVGQRTGALYELERELTAEREGELDATLPQDLLVVLAEHKRVWQGVYSRLLTTSTHLAAWFLSSSTHGTGHWMTWRGGSDGRFRFSPEEYIEISSYASS